MKDINLKIFKNKMSNSYFFGSRPVQDWPKILIVSTVILVIMIVWSYFFFLSVKSEISNDFSGVGVTNIKDKGAEIQEILEVYQKKEIMFME